MLNTVTMFFMMPFIIAAMWTGVIARAIHWAFWVGWRAGESVLATIDDRLIHKEVRREAE